jgi:hypothetical protein
MKKVWTVGFWKMYGEVAICIPVVLVEIYMGGTLIISNFKILSIEDIKLAQKIWEAKISAI